ncbi:MAG: light harvesting complex A [Monoraphidium minutum]|nr:MAG: light harvesting complex A [Monoraphidium minutum]
MQVTRFSAATKVAGSRTSARRTTVRVQANAGDAAKWVENWQTKQAATANRISWFPGSKLPDHLDGSMPGDYGFDPLGLGKDSGKLRWYQQAELVHCRFAMLGAAGILVPDLFHAIGAGGPAAQIPWYDHAKYEYYAPINALFGVQMILFAWVEMRRLQDIRNPGSVNGDPIFTQYSLPQGELGYPGGIFDPLGYSKGNMAELKVKEIKNGRLAMLGFLGFCAQAYTTGTTPLTNLATHLANPFETTVFSNDLARL